MNARRILLAAFVTAIAGLSAACSAAPGEELGRGDDALKACTGLECNGTGGAPAPTPWIDNCEPGGQLGDVPLSPFGLPTPLGNFENGLKGLRCVQTLTIVAGSSSSQLLQTFCPFEYQTIPATACPDGIYGLFTPGEVTTLTLSQFIECYGGLVPVSPVSVYVDPCTNVEATGGFYVDFDPTCTGRGCVVLPSGGAGASKT